MALTKTPIELSSTQGIVDNSNATAITIDSSENVGIGGSTITDANLLNIQGSGASKNIGVVFNDTNTSKIFSIQNGGSALKFFDYTASAERMRIDSSGILLVGKSATGIATVGAELKATGELLATVNSDACAFLNRKTSDGDIAVFRKDNTTVGSIGTSGGKLDIDGPANNSGLRFHESSLIPKKNDDVTNGQVDLGYNDGSTILGFRNLTLSGGVYANNASGAFLWNAENAHIAFGTNNTERMRIDSSGNVGIGISSPVTTLTVSNTTQNDTLGIAQVVNTTANDASNSSMTVKNHSGTGQFMQWEHYGMRVGNRITTNNGVGEVVFTQGNDVEKMRLTANGLGIGTSSPVNNSNRTTLGLQGAWGGQLDIMVGSTVHAQFGTDNFSSGQSCRIQSQDGILFKAGGSTERMRIDSSGNVGIGVSTPSNNHANANNLVVGNGTSGGIANYVGTGTGWYAFSRANANNSDAYDGGISYDGSRNLKFHTNAGTERMRIDSSGNFFISCTSLPAGGIDAMAYQNTGDTALRISSTGTGGSYQIRFFNANGEVGNIISSGSSTSYNTSSDQRLKENIADADDAGSKIDAIQVRQYDWKVDGSHQDYGMIAQELQAVAPEAVSGDADSEEMMGVDYSKLVPMLIKEIQSLRNRVAQLEE